MVPGTERFVVSDDGAYEAYRRALPSNDAGGVQVSFGRSVPGPRTPHLHPAMRLLLPSDGSRLGLRASVAGRSAGPMWRTCAVARRCGRSRSFGRQERPWPILRVIETKRCRSPSASCWCCSLRRTPRAPYSAGSSMTPSPPPRALVVRSVLNAFPCAEAPLCFVPPRTSAVSGIYWELPQLTSSMLQARQPACLTDHGL